MKKIATIVGLVLSVIFCSNVAAAERGLLNCKANQVKTFFVYSLPGKTEQRNVFVCIAADLYGTEVGIKSVQSILTEREGRPVVVTFFARSE